MAHFLKKYDLLQVFITYIWAVFGSKIGLFTFSLLVSG